MGTVDHPFEDNCHAGCEPGTHRLCTRFNCFKTAAEHPALIETDTQERCRCKGCTGAPECRCCVSNQLMREIDTEQRQESEPSHEDVCPTHGQQRDNWSKEQVRALRKKVRNLRAELKTQSKAVREKLAHTAKTLEDLRSEHSKNCHHLQRSQRGWERRMNQVVAENQWWQEEIKNIVAVIEYNHPRMQDRGGYYISDVLFMLRFALAHPMYPPEATPEPLSELVRLRGALWATGGLRQLAQCPTCLAERTNGERHADDCALFEITQEKTDGSKEDSKE